MSVEKVNIGKTSAGASLAVIAGALVNGKPNYINLGSYGGVSANPAMVYISVNKAHYTNTGIKENGYFSVNIPNKAVVRELDYVGIVSGKDTDKSGVFTAFYGSVNKAPLIQECPVNILCKLTNTVDLPKNEVFIGEIVETYVSQDCLTDGKPDVKKINPLLLAARKYWELGALAGNAWEDGKLYKK